MAAWEAPLQPGLRTCASAGRGVLQGALGSALCSSPAHLLAHRSNFTQGTKAVRPRTVEPLAIRSLRAFSMCRRATTQLCHAMEERCVSTARSLCVGGTLTAPTAPQCGLVPGPQLAETQSWEAANPKRRRAPAQCSFLALLPPEFKVNPAS